MADRRGNPTIQVRLAADSPVRAQLTDRATRAADGGTPALATQVTSDLRVLYALLGAELAQQEWTLGELGMLAEITSGPLLDVAVSTGPVSILQAELYDGTRGAADAWQEKWGVHPDAVYARLGELGPTGEHALKDALSRWWATAGEHSVRGWAAVGIRVAGPWGAR